MKNKQTETKNINSFSIPKSILLTGKILQTVSKSLAATFAGRIFSTPPIFKVPERELMMRKSAKNEIIDIPAIGKNVMIYTYGYSKKKVLLVHGWAGRGTQLYHLADKILENKMMVVSFDGPGHGLSSGKRIIMTDFIKTIYEIDKKYGPFHAAIGHSFGGISLLNSAASGVKFNKLVTIGTDNSIPKILTKFVKKLELKPIISKKIEKQYKKKYGVSINNYSSHFAAKKIKIPTLIIHDSEDKFVPVSSAIEIRQYMENGELLITNGLGHHKIFKDNLVIQRIINFLQ